MRLIWKTKKSAGVRVEPRVHRLIKEGDAARNGADWTKAAAHYRAALALAPRLPHILVQLGHALKHSGYLADADAVYAEAARQDPGDPDPLWHRSRLALQNDRFPAAVVHVAAMLRRDRTNTGALEELRRLFDAVGPVPPEQLLALIDQIPTEISLPPPALPPARRAPAADVSQDRRPLVFDVSDLIGHYREQRLPNGIQRVQTEVLSAHLADRAIHEVTACCLVPDREGWLEVPLALCRDLIRLSGTGSDVHDPDWQAARSRLYLHLALAETYVLPWRARLVNLGTSFWMHDYFRLIRNAKIERAVSYVPLVYDLIPIVKPDVCVEGWIRDFTIWLTGAFQHADGFLAISQSAKQDLLRTAACIGHELPDDRVEVVPLDADFRREGELPPPPGFERRQPADSPFVLMVSTIEPRKNHALAFDVWADLLRRHGPVVMPRLVCVGRDGWMNDAVFDRLDTDALLAEHVTLIPRLSDAELARLYRDCRFTLFPSVYEGWGLPVTESLCHGRVVIAADNSSLIEAGAGLALHFASGSASELMQAVELALFDDAWLANREARIAAEFTPRSWLEIARQIESASRRLANRARPDDPAPVVEPGLYYPVARYHGDGIWRGAGSGEVFRVGDGWLWSDVDGSRTKPDGGVLRLGLRENAGRPLRLYIGLRGLETIDCPADVLIDGVRIGGMTVRPRKLGWVACDLPAGLGPDCALLVRGEFAEIMPSPRGHRAASIAVAGFFACEQADGAANNGFIAARRGDLRLIDAYRRR